MLKNFIAIFLYQACSTMYALIYQYFVHYHTLIYYPPVFYHHFFLHFVRTVTLYFGYLFSGIHSSTRYSVVCHRCMGQTKYSNWCSVLKTKYFNRALSLMLALGMMLARCWLWECHGSFSSKYSWSNDITLFMSAKINIANEISFSD